MTRSERAAVGRQAAGDGEAALAAGRRWGSDGDTAAARLLADLSSMSCSCRMNGLSSSRRGRGERLLASSPAPAPPVSLLLPLICGLRGVLLYRAKL